MKDFKNTFSYERWRTDEPPGLDYWVLSEHTKKRVWLKVSKIACGNSANRPPTSRTLPRVVALAAEINRLVETKEKDPKADQSSAA